jgi:hypothetical protein
VKSVVFDDCETDLIVLKVQKMLCLSLFESFLFCVCLVFPWTYCVCLQISEPREDQPYLELSGEYPEEGEEVFVISTPEGLEGVVSPGIVSALHNSIDLQITCPISSGSSGGPVFNYYVRFSQLSQYSLSLSLH